MGSKVTVAGFFTLIGLISVFSGYTQTNKQRQLKNEAGKQGVEN